MVNCSGLNKMDPKPVCTRCFEEQRGKRGSNLLKETYLKRKEHKGGPSVSVHLTKENALEPVIRPMPEVYFRGKFRVCSGQGCKGLKYCTFAHCDKERDAWNAEKFSVDLPFGASRVHSLSASVSHSQDRRVSRPLSLSRSQPSPLQSPETKEPWPDFPGFGAKTIKQLRTRSAPPTTTDPPSWLAPPPYPQAPVPASVSKKLYSSTVVSKPHMHWSNLSRPVRPPQRPRDSKVGLPPHSGPLNPHKSGPISTPAPHESSHIQRSRLISPPVGPRSLPQKDGPISPPAHPGSIGPLVHHRLSHPHKGVMQQPLSELNYMGKFLELLKSEQDAHSEILKQRCDGSYPLVVCQAGQKPGELKFDAKPFHKRFGYLKDMEGDQVGYATQSASTVSIHFDHTQIYCDILRENNYHTRERLYIAFDGNQLQRLSNELNITKKEFKSDPEQLIRVEFQLKFSYFSSLKQAIRRLPADVIACILPKKESFVAVTQVSSSTFKQYRELCSQDQLNALMVIASCPHGGPPVLIAGPFGTGKTRVLALVAHYFLKQSIETGNSLRILVCTQQQTSADAYLEMYDNLTKEDEPIKIIRLVTIEARRKGSLSRFYKSASDFKRDIERNSYRNRQKFLIITTCLTARHINEVLPPSFFTHIFLDEGAQMREPEAVSPLCMAGKATKVVIAGDKHQVGPAMLVLGEDPQKFGLSTSLLERLYSLYHSPQLKDMAKSYCAHLVTNYRCHRQILSLAQQVAYRMELKCEVPDSTAHPRTNFPLQFICSSINAMVESAESNINESEVKIALKAASEYFLYWPDHRWGKKDISQFCFLSPSRGQVTVARQPIRALPPQVKNVRKLPTYMIQGQEFRALFISTSEPTKPNGETLDPTKSISDPFVFITAITRAQSLVVAVGNPFLMLKREKHMVHKYPEKGHCWSLFLQACLKNNSLTFDESLGMNERGKEKCLSDLDDQLNQYTQTQDLHVHLPLQLEQVPSEASLLSEDSQLGQPSQNMPQRRESGSNPSIFQIHYDVKELLGQGGFGMVRHAVNKLDGRECAIKIIKLDSSQDEQVVKREVQALAKLDHGNIVRYFNSWMEQAPADWKTSRLWEPLRHSQSGSLGAIGTSDSSAQAARTSTTTTPALSSESSGQQAAEDSASSSVVFQDTSSGKRLTKALIAHVEQPWCLFIVTELCAKNTLREWLKLKEKRKRNDILNYFKQILEAVKCIHNEGMMHRDLKPSNILFSLKDDRVIKVGDFGFVTTSQETPGQKALHSSNLGTAFYVSPEQNAGRQYTEKVDIYALGIIFFEMNCPFGTEMECCTVLGKLRERGSFPGKFEDNLPQEAQLIRSMLTEDPKDRPSAEEIASSPSLKRLQRQLRKSVLLCPAIN